MTIIHLASLAFFAMCGGIAVAVIIDAVRPALLAAALILDRGEAQHG